jgi:hypothetical protein
MKAICKKISQNRKTIDDLKTNNRVLTDSLIRDYGNVMKQDKFWEFCTILRENIEDRREAVKNECYEQGVHNFFCHMAHPSMDSCGNERVRATYQDMVDFVFTYHKAVKKVASDDELWKHASKFEYFSDDGWYDFTNFLPLEGREAYEHVLNKGGEIMDNGTNPWTREHEGYICSNLDKKLCDYSNHGLTEEEEDEIWI